MIGFEAGAEPLRSGEARRIAEELRQARADRRTLVALSSWRPLSLTDAYRVQDELTELRLAAGETQVGWKVCYTSRVMREQMGVDGPTAAPLTDAMLLPDGAPVPVTSLQPRVEAEIALLIGGGGRVVAARTALEVVDSVWSDYRFSLEDTTADASSAAWLVLGDELPLEGLDRVEVQLKVDGEVLATGRGADADGHPLRCLTWLHRHLRDRGWAVQPGQIVLTGAVTRAVPPTGPVVAEFRTADGTTLSASVLPPPR